MHTVSRSVTLVRPMLVELVQFVVDEVARFLEGQLLLRRFRLVRMGANVLKLLWLNSRLFIVSW